MGDLFRDGPVEKQSVHFVIVWVRPSRP